MKGKARTPEERRQRRRRALQFWSFFVLFLGLTSLAWAGYSALFVRWFGRPDPFWAQVTAVWAALITLSAVGLVWGFLENKRRPDIFGPFNEALRSIARGDYNVRVPLDQRPDGPAASFRELASNLNAMAGALARLEQLRQQFVADVSHEFQSPLTSVLGFAQALKTPGLPEEQRLRYLGIIETEARRLSRLADNLLKLTALEDRDGPPDPAPFRVDVQLRRVLVALEPQWSAKGLDVTADLEAIETVGNEELWTQVWTNLVQNAVKFTPRGGRITVRSRQGPPMVVEVEDSGIGLSSDEAPRVFERFYKAEASRTHADGVTGSGLGLALAHRIVTLHGAVLEAHSPGRGLGTTLRVTGLPVPGPKD